MTDDCDVVVATMAVVVVKGSETRRRKKVGTMCNQHSAIKQQQRERLTMCIKRSWPK
ncbi:hypothetical protein ml_190 [Mollivirus sibericum]|uniref:hypothetical protein n=1 Tax=Mollivirus sibericum TaxID=1678078 RepID=UPI0006B2EC74|nr:hypothetical protein ml_190 [Mollivirus sibericum]ALD61992.1 hypothetical protein ml_190 [Mollivirus sibericum]